MKSDRGSTQTAICLTHLFTEKPNCSTFRTDMKIIQGVRIFRNLRVLVQNLYKEPIMCITSKPIIRCLFRLNYVMSFRCATLWYSSVTPYVIPVARALDKREFLMIIRDNFC